MGHNSGKISRNKTTATFTRFLELPVEVRLLIWDMAVQAIDYERDIINVATRSMVSLVDNAGALYPPAYTKYFKRGKRVVFAVRGGPSDQGLIRDWTYEEMEVRYAKLCPELGRIFLIAGVGWNMRRRTKKLGNRKYFIEIMDKYGRGWFKKCNHGICHHHEKRCSPTCSTFGKLEIQVFDYRQYLKYEIKGRK